MMSHRFLILILGMATLTVSSYASAGTGGNGIQLNGVRSNGVELNGHGGNGIGKNGGGTNGISNNGGGINGSGTNGGGTNGTATQGLEASNGLGLNSLAQQPLAKKKN